MFVDVTCRMLGSAALLLTVACGGRTTLLDGEASLGAAGSSAGGSGAASATTLKSWDRVKWDKPVEESPVYLWTGSVNDTWAVISTEGNADGTCFRDHWNGSSWTRTPSQRNQTSRFDRQQVWGGSNGRAFGGSSQSLERWSAGAWSDWAQSPGCSALGGSAEDDIWCATATELWHFDGATWARSPMSGVQGILALERDDAWAWGTDGASHFDGVSWSVQLIGLVQSVSASDAQDVWAVKDGVLLHAAGPNSPWASQNPSGSQIAGVWSQSRTNTWIVAAGAAMRWDGSRWITLDLPAQDELLRISGSSQDVWLGGTQKLLHGRANGTGI